MKSREAFKQSIFEKRERYLRRKKARQRQLAALLPVCAVALAAGIGLLPHRMTDGVPTELYTDAATNIVPESGKSVTATLFGYPSAEPIGTLAGAPAEALYDLLTRLAFDESSDETDSVPDGTSTREGYRIELADGKGTVMTVFYFEDGTLCVGGATRTLTEAQNRQLGQLVAALIEK